jgi:hypothetical protein
MVAHLLNEMEIRDIAKLWGQETSQPPKVYERVLIEFFLERNNLASWLIDSSSTLTREDVRTFCCERQIDPPQFWFGAKESLASAEARCRKWLVDKASENKCMSKKEYRKLAIKEIEGLSKRAFDRAWDASMPSAWKRAGRPKKS